jgi:hypothetical protein
MHPLLPRSTIVLAAVLAAGMVNSASAQNSASAPTSPDLKARCDQLISYFDRYGASRSENSDGARNMTDMGARIDCEQGRYDKGVAAMETLLKQKGFDVPPAQTTGIAEKPATLRPHGEKRHSTGQ